MLKIGTIITSGQESRHIVFLDDEESTFHLCVLILANGYFGKIIVVLAYLLILTETKFFGFDFF